MAMKKRNRLYKIKKALCKQQQEKITGKNNYCQLHIFIYIKFLRIK